jgi:pentatricopeptide repeat protein
VSDVDVESLYQILKEPVRKTIVQPTRKLSNEYVKSLQERVKNALKAKDYNVQSNEIEGLVVPPDSIHKDVTDLIIYHAESNNITQAQNTFNQLLESGNMPCISTVNALIQACVSVDDVQSAMKVFKDTQKYNLSPNIKSFELLTSAFAIKGMYVRAYNVLQNMKSLHIQPTPQIYHNIINACIKSGNYKRAWTLFDMSRTELNIPTLQLYNTMIHACSYTQDAEKALDLVHDMTDNGITPSPLTYAALMKTLSTRKEYYMDIFGILGQMVDEGLEVTKEVYDVLLDCFVERGDVWKAREVWNKMVNVSGGVDSRPSAKNVECMLLTISKAMSLIQRDENVPARESVECLKSIQCDSNVNTSGNENYLMQFEDLSSKSLLGEADKLWTLIQPTSVTSEIIDAYLKVYTKCNLTKYTFPKAKEIFDSYYEKYGVERSGKSFQLMLKMITRDKKLMSEHNEWIWKELLTWDENKEKEIDENAERYLQEFSLDDNMLEDGLKKDNEKNEKILLVDETLMQEFGQDEKLAQEIENDPEYTLVYKTKPTLTNIEREEIRKMQYRDKENMIENFKLMIRGYARYYNYSVNDRINDLEQSIGLIERSKDFRHPYYLPSIQFKDIWSVVSKALDTGDRDADRRYMNRLIELCPKSEDPLEEVKRMLRQRFMSRDWWGWGVLGIGRKTREELIKKSDEGYWRRKRRVKKTR